MFFDDEFSIYKKPPQTFQVASFIKRITLRKPLQHYTRPIEASIKTNETSATTILKC